MARGDVSPAGLKRKCDWVLDTMEYRMKRPGRRLEAGDGDADLHRPRHPCAGAEDPERIQPSSITRHNCRPPIEELEYEMDLRGVSVERVL